MTNDSNKDVITVQTTATTYCLQYKKCQMIQIKRMNDYAPLLHNGIFHRKNNGLHTISFTLLKTCV